MSKHKVKKRIDKRSFKLKLKKETIFSISQLFFFALSILVLVSFSRQGLALLTLNNLLVTYFDWSAIFLPFLFLSFSFLISKTKFPLGQPNVIVGGLLFFVSIMALGKAGVFGIGVWEGISALLAPVGSWLLFFCTAFVGLIVMFNTSIEQVFKVLSTWWKIIFGYVKTPTEVKINNRSVMQKDLPKTLSDAPLKIGGDVAVINKPLSIKSSQNLEPLEQKIVSSVQGVEKVWRYPSFSILGELESGKAERGDVRGNATKIEDTLRHFGIISKVLEINPGPAVTQYAIEVAPGTKLSKITALERDLALALSAPTGAIRIEAPIPGRNLVGIEMPNKSPEFVTLRKVLESDEMVGNKNKLAVALGLDVSGRPIVANIAKMPHVLIAGQTGSGKSVCINTFLASILFRAAPTEVKLILVDPKRVEMTGYRDIPHLLTPVIVEPEKVIKALRWVMAEMDRRYKLFAEAGARNIEGYNEMSGFQAVPYIVVVIDELADIMLFSPVEVEDAITRIAQMSRATGIHMVLATQRPSVDVITGLIKANVPSRIAFAVSSQIDSRVILDTQGAEKLLGKGDMLYLPPEAAKPIRIQGAFVNDKEIGALVDFIKKQGIEPQYTPEVTTQGKPGGIQVGGVETDIDKLFEKAVEVVCMAGRASSSLLQRRLQVGYSRAAKIMDQLEASGVISPADGSSKAREVLIKSPDELRALSGGGEN